MGAARVIIVSLAIVTTAGSPSNNSTGCEASCWRCSSGAGARARCLALCLDNGGPPALCRTRQGTSLYSHSELLVGGSIGLVVCAMLAVGGLLCLRCRSSSSRRRDSLPKQSHKALKHFHRDLDRLRPHAYTFLAILNNVRRQVREMHRAGSADAAFVCGRSLSDLAKILMLLNRRDLPIVPPDWPRLCSWADELLERTRHTFPQPQPPVAQLIQFLQAPVHRGPPNTAQSTPMSTLKPPAYEESISTQDSLAFTDFSFQAENNWCQKWQFPKESRLNGNEDAWKGRNSTDQTNVWLDDDFMLMSFRPQDEIVTVL